MRYLGGKSRLSKHIAKVILRNIEGCQQYAEPFVGSAAVAERVAQEIDTPIVLSDASPDLIRMYWALQRGWIPPSHVSEEMYNLMKESDRPSAIRGFVGYGCSWGGKFFGGYARGEDRNYAAESKRALLKTISVLQDAEFLLHDYRDIDYHDSMIYCDPPYRGTTAYENVPDFNSDQFWERVRYWSERNIVICSEYFAPSDFICIWEKGHTTSIRPKGGNEMRKERLFVRKSLSDKIATE